MYWMWVAYAAWQPTPCSPEHSFQKLLPGADCVMRRWFDGLTCQGGLVSTIYKA